MKGKILAAILFAVILPSLMLYRFRPVDKQPSIDTPTEETTVSSGPEKSAVITLLREGETSSVDLEDYITGVVLAEMPAAFEMEALKAQAVVARTFALKKAGASKHPNADVCADPGCCQAYLPVSEYLSAGGKKEDAEKVVRAVADTKGKVLTYQGQLIEATYFSCSGGRTEDAAAVWGSDVPYLQSVDSPGEEKATHYTDTVTYTAKEFLVRLQLPEGKISIDAVSYTDGGGVDQMTVNGKTYSGTQLRKLLGLRSTAFMITVVGDSTVITTKGFGHRVGMSQYGADAMAVQGSLYPEILEHYYPGTVLTDHS